MDWSEMEKEITPLFSNSCICYSYSGFQVEYVSVC